uniref:Uncharacterized protein n=1 Tax=Candidatus Kentrum sp. LFY TaxID=2126342 RepID=A0A450X0H7_9GAMM|nr:MAG: hypothetical protein BECKLFY1418C_GA0070996_11274 [Candidatus Kentron sp. LFY]
MVSPCFLQILSRTYCILMDRFWSNNYNNKFESGRIMTSTMKTIQRQSKNRKAFWMPHCPCSPSGDCAGIIDHNTKASSHFPITHFTAAIWCYSHRPTKRPTAMAFGIRGCQTAVSSAEVGGIRKKQKPLRRPFGSILNSGDQNPWAWWR